MSDPMQERYKLTNEQLEELKRSTKDVPMNAFTPLEEIPPLTADDITCFSEIKEVLSKHGKLERFGITLLHKHFNFDKNEVLLETTNKENRSMVLEPKIIDSSDINTIDTQWYLGGSIPLSLVKCRTNWHQ